MTKVGKQIRFSMIQQADEALQEGEERYRRLVELSPDGIAIQGEDRLTFINAAGTRLLGAAGPEALLNRSILDFVHPDDRESIRQQLQQASVGMSVLPSETRFIRLDKTIIEVEIAVTPFTDRGPAAAQFVFRAITRRKQAETARQRQLAELTTLHAVATAGAEATSVDKLVERTARIMGETLYLDNFGVGLVDETAGLLRIYQYYRKPQVVVRQETVSLGLGVAGQVVATGRARRIPDVRREPGYLLTQPGMRSELCVPLKVGEQVIGVVNAESRQLDAFSADDERLLMTVAGQLATAIARIRLFAETRLLLERSQQQARQVQQIIDSIFEGILLLDAKGHIVLANPLAEKYLALLTQVKPGEVLTHLAGRPVKELLQPSPNGLAYQLEVAGPPVQIFKASAQPVEAGPQVGGWVLLIRNITQEHEIQQRAQQQERLAMIGQLAAGISHDFNNMLTGIIGFAELARFGQDRLRSPEETLDRIIQQGRQAARLIRQIMDFSHQSVIEKQVLDLIPVVRETVKLLERIIPEDIQISLEIEPGQYMLQADPTQIQQILTNLMVNARDAMPKGGALRLRLRNVTFGAGEALPCPDLSPGNWLAIAVSDNGSGIAPEALPHLFEPFFTTKKAGQGTGLGLAQVYGIVKQHGGDVDVESQPGQGATFTIYLPASAQTKRKPSPAARRNMPVGQGEVILVVEDDTGVLDIMQRLLESLSYRVLTAGNGQEALELYDGQPTEIDLVLTDVTMPQMGGIALLQALRERNPAMKVIATTGYGPEAETRELLSQGFATCLQKPISIEQVAQTVYQTLRDSQAE